MKTTAAGLAACLAAAAHGQVFEFDPGLGWASPSGVGTGRSVYFTADEAFTISSAGMMCTMTPGEYQCVIYAGAGEFAPPGALLASANANVGTGTMQFNDIPINFSFQAGQDYILHFRSTTVGGTLATAYQRVFWGDGGGEDKDIGIVTLRDGREGYDAQNYTNVAFPRMQVTLVSSVCYPDCNGDQQLNLSDFGCFTTKFALGDPYADCNGDAVLNLSDFGCFTTKFALGCP